MSEWQPIETAPRDKFVLVGWTDEHGESRLDFDQKEEDCWIRHYEYREYAISCAPPGSTLPKRSPPYTHWMDIKPLPAAIPNNDKT